MRLAHLTAAVVLIGLLAGLLGAAGPARADGPPESSEPPVEGWSADPRLWLALIEWRQRLRLELESSRELCTAGTLTEVSWEISGGKPPYSLQVEGASVDVDADNARINCGALSEAEAADEAADLAAKRITAVVTDARGVRREAALDVARARALPALDAVGDIRPYHDALTFTWGGIDVSRCSTAECYALRWRPIGEATWRIALFQFSPHVSDALDFYIDGLSSGRSYEAATAAIRDRIENETPDALIWSSTVRGVTLTIPTGLTAAATYDTVTLRWDRQPSATQYYVWLNGGDGGLSNHITDDDEAAWGDPSGEFHEVVFRDLPSGMEFTAIVVSEYASDGSSIEATTKVRTLPMPSDREALPRGPQNLRVTATPTSITATWDEPFSGAPSGYIVSLYHPSVETPWLEWVWAPDLTVTFQRVATQCHLPPRCRTARPCRGPGGGIGDDDSSAVGCGRCYPADVSESRASTSVAAAVALDTLMFPGNANRAQRGNSHRRSFVSLTLETERTNNAYPDRSGGTRLRGLRRACVASCACGRSTRTTRPWETCAGYLLPSSPGRACCAGARWARRPRWAISRLPSFASIAGGGYMRCGVARCSC